jgi:hypothetical protein
MYPTFHRLLSWTDPTTDWFVTSNLVGEAWLVSFSSLLDSSFCACVSHRPFFLLLAMGRPFQGEQGEKFNQRWSTRKPFDRSPFLRSPSVRFWLLLFCALYLTVRKWTRFITRRRERDFLLLTNESSRSLMSADTEIVCHHTQ